MDRFYIALALLIVAAGIGGFYYLGDHPTAVRVAVVLGAVIVAALVAVRSEPGRAAWEFAKGARLEARKVVWPTRRETSQTTMIVIALVILVGLYIWFLDTVLAWAVRALIVDS